MTPLKSRGQEVNEMKALLGAFFLFFVAITCSKKSWAFSTLSPELEKITMDYADGSRLHLKVCGTKLCSLRVRVNGLDLRLTQEELALIVDPLIWDAVLYVEFSTPSEPPAGSVTIPMFDESLKKNGDTGVYYRVSFVGSRVEQISKFTRPINWHD